MRYMFYLERSVTMPQKYMITILPEEGNMLTYDLERSSKTYEAWDDKTNKIQIKN